jgi:hypothetical protein
MNRQIPIATLLAFLFIAASSAPESDRMVKVPVLK